MEENTNAIMDEEFGVDLTDAFESEPETGNQTGDGAASEEQQQETGNEPAQQPEGTGEPAPEGGQQQPEAPDQEDGSVVANYMGQEIKVPKAEQLAWIQKGMDRDRVAQQRDDLRNQLSEQQQWRTENEGNLSQLQSLADAAFGGDVGKAINAIRVQFKVSQGYSKDAALQAVRNEDLQKQIDTRNKQDQARKEAQEAQARQQQRQQQDINAFVQKYPKVNPQSIPQSVWADVRGGSTLVSAYDHFLSEQAKQKELDELKAEITALKRNKTNQAQSMGSAKSAGQNSSDKQDDFLSGMMSAW